MVFMEHFGGDSDFRSVYKSVDREYREAEEQKTLRNFMNLLDEFDSEIGTRKKQRHHHSKRHRGRYTKEHMTADDGHGSDTECSSDDESDDETPAEAQPRIAKENFRVSIVDDEGAKKQNEEEKRLKQEVVDRKKVHTLDDLPREDLNLFQLFPEPEPKASDFSITGGRRVSDGKISYKAGFPSLNDTLKIGEFSFDLDYIILVVLVIFIVGFFIGKFANGLTSRRVLTRTVATMNKRLKDAEAVIQKQSQYIMDQNMIIMNANAQSQQHQQHLTAYLQQQRQHRHPMQSRI